ncbi:hypothetical protein DFH09DRAFT_1306706 [Mycena vulgaris]|nr:hypothetical protein DFH09DRAFT_1306706 [Mycena vulgaris]
MPAIPSSSSSSDSSSETNSKLYSLISSAASLKESSLKETRQEMQTRVLRARQIIEDSMNQLVDTIIPLSIPKVTSTNWEERANITKKNVEKELAALALYTKQLQAWKDNLSPQERASLASTPEEAAEDERLLAELLGDDFGRFDGDDAVAGHQPFVPGQVPNFPVVDVEGQSITVSNLSVKFGTNFKGQLVTAVLFNIVNGNGNALREGWTQIFEMFQNLFLHSLLPTCMLQMEDFLEGVSMIPLRGGQPPRVAPRSDGDAIRM